MMATSRAGGSGTTTTTHGVKRSASDPPENDQRLAKRFDLLNLEHHGKRYIPVPAQGQRPSTQQALPPKPRIEPQTEDDFMQVENTQHKVYIYDLDKELADVESDEENPIFLADIEKQLSKIPKHVLQNRPELKPTNQNQLILYNVPSSLTIPEEQDKVRRAIEEARARIKKQQATLPIDFRNNGTCGYMGNAASSDSVRGHAVPNGHADLSDPDAMEIEEL